MTYEIFAALGGAAVLGFFGSAHCIGMCGPIVAALSLETGTESTSFWPGAGVMKYSVGRMFGYSLFGGALGAIGYKLDGVAGGRSYALLIAGAIMLIYGACSFGASFWLHKVKLSESGGVIARVFGWLQAGFAKLKQYGPRIAGAIGLATAFMPCGLLYAAYAQAIAARHPVTGAAVMLVFALSSTPAFWLLGAIMRRLQSQQSYRLWFQRLAAIIVIAMGVNCVWQGLAKPEAKSCCHCEPAQH